MTKESPPIEFNLTFYKLQSQAVCDSLTEVFSMDGEALKERAIQYEKAGTLGGKAITIRCTPEQFCRFLMTRHAKGGSNGWVDLKAHFYEPAAQSDLFDVTESVT